MNTIDHSGGIVEMARITLALMIAVFMVSFSATADAETNLLHSGVVPADAVANITNNVAIDAAVDGINNASTVKIPPMEDSATAHVEETEPQSAPLPIPNSIHHASICKDACLSIFAESLKKQNLENWFIASDRSEREYAKRYAELNDAHNAFIQYLMILVAILAALVTIFGAVLPTVMAVLQQRRSDKELETVKQQLHDEMNMANDVREKEMKSIRHFILLNSRWSLAKSVEMFDMDVEKKMSDVSTRIELMFSLSTILLGFVELLRQSAEIGEKTTIRDVIVSFRPFFDRWQNSTDSNRKIIWESAFKGVAGAADRLGMVSVRDACSNVLGVHSDEFKWLEKTLQWKEGGN